MDEHTSDPSVTLPPETRVPADGEHGTLRRTATRGVGLFDGTHGRFESMWPSVDRSCRSRSGLEGPPADR